MKFVQTIAWTSSREEELLAMIDRFMGEHPEPGPGTLNVKLLKDRDRENAYMIIVEFEDYDLAMQNSALPETDAFAREMAALADGPPTFTNLDVLREDATGSHRV